MVCLFRFTPGDNCVWLVMADTAIFGASGSCQAGGGRVGVGLVLRGGVTLVTADTAIC